MEEIVCTVVVVDDSGQIVAVDGVDGSFGITPDFAGRSWGQAFEGWDLPALPLQPSQARSCQTYVTTPSGQFALVEIMPVPTRDGHGQTMVIFRNAVNGSISQRQQQLCGLGEISAGVAHEMNNALTLLIGWLELLLADFKHDQQLHSTLQLLMDESNRIAQLTRNLLDVARGDQAMDQDISLSELFVEVLTLVRYEMRNSNIELESSLPESLPPIRGNSGRLKQALLNLLLNARQAMPDGGKVRVSATEDGAGFIRVAVADTGCGISEETRPRIFSPFFTTKRDGTGLGLSVTRKIVEDHGGSLDMESTPGKGARFTLSFPMTTAKP